MTIVVPLVILAAVYWALCRRWSPRGKPFPGPSSVPILGNALQLPRRKVWEKLHEWGNQYGPIYAFRVLGTPVLVLDTAEAGRELLDEKSALYANRPLPKIIELAGFDKGVVLEHDPSRLRHARKLLHTVLQPKQLSQYREAMLRHVDDLLYNLLHDPEDFVQHLCHLTAGITMEISHGHRVTSRKDPYVEKANEFVHNFSEATSATTHLANWLPSLATLPSFLPGMGFKRKAKAWREQYFSLAEEGHQMVKDEITRGTAMPSLTYKALEESGPGEHPDDIIMFTATQVYTGGADTTVSTLSSFILFMTQHPDVQRKAQEELKRVIGSDRLPTYEDRASLPYVDAIMVEVLRLRPPVSIGEFARMASKEDVHNGCTVEEDTLVFVNFWGMLRDENHYPDPHAFRPERWAGKERNPDIHPLHIAFGFGRRICPGQHLAQELVFVTMARMLALFEIFPVRDESGRPVVPSDDSTNGGITFPVPFRCRILPRSDRAAQVLQGFCEHQE